MANSHSRTSGDAATPLYDDSVPTPTHAERARTLAEGLGTGTLSTLATDPAGHPYGSVVTFAFENASDGRHPVFLLSELAEHTRNLRADGRASLLVAEAGEEDPLANGRVTLLGWCAIADGAEDVRAAYLAKHPNAAYYADFKDFHFWRLTVESVRYIGGYGRMSWVSAEDWLSAQADPLAKDAARIIEHMNADHADALVGYCHAFTKATQTERAVLTGVDRYGFEMSVDTNEGPRPVRLAFPREITTATEAREAFVELLRRAREKNASG